MKNIDKISIYGSTGKIGTKSLLIIKKYSFILQIELTELI